MQWKYGELLTIASAWIARLGKLIFIIQFFNQFDLRNGKYPRNIKRERECVDWVEREESGRTILSSFSASMQCVLCFSVPFYLSVFIVCCSFTDCARIHSYPIHSSVYVVSSNRNVEIEFSFSSSLCHSLAFSILPPPIRPRPRSQFIMISLKFLTLVLYSNGKKCNYITSY